MSSRAANAQDDFEAKGPVKGVEVETEQRKSSRSCASSPTMVRSCPNRQERGRGVVGKIIPAGELQGRALPTPPNSPRLKADHPNSRLARVAAAVTPR